MNDARSFFSSLMDGAPSFLYMYACSQKRVREAKGEGDEKEGGGQLIRTSL